ncbi:MAG: 3-oxoacid CoA-transferase subunit A [Oscillospiraceae bacterium]|nr:3-oxoacid CoA-transferase subunit A [Oscillospiraceae bacterium]MCD7743148.1 3-oxoacid CoA-transferase subunit A [Oscillospiraceae bacterium]MCD7768387.1 3-oxoacid CoA-transferase subunit A [Oscillospiraceae bacterium]MCD7786721.1 3-oxoacid CoA-transferase subunit A [Oscillospiraceae bacterium]MCD7853962.1 3-oxoacid CoA-transferase subunit A [Oscillospiraceae bacterium]
MPKFVSIEEAAKLIPDGATVMFGGFMGCGSAHKLIDALSKSGVKDLTVIANDASMPGGPLGEEYYALAKLVHNKQIKKLIATHVGLNPEVATQNMVDGTLEVVLIPQGSMAEMIRAGGGGLGGVLTPTGVGTIVEENPYCLGKQTINGRDYLLMAPLHADFAVIAGAKIDKNGNVWYKGDTSNFNIVMATAADTVIAEAEEIVEQITPEDVRTSGVFVDYVVEGGKY